MSEWAPIVVSLLALAGGVYATVTTVRTSREAEEGKRELERIRRELDDDDRRRRLADRYQEPLVRAAYELQSRIWNVLQRDFLRAFPSEVESTAWLFGQYLGWVEILRRELQFLPLSDEKRREVQDAIYKAASACASDRFADEHFRIFRSTQRGLGELMICQGADAEGRQRSDCLGLAAFKKQLDDSDSDLHEWLAPLISDLRSLADGAGIGRVRLTKLQRALIDLINAVDPDYVRFPNFRDRVILDT